MSVYVHPTAIIEDNVVLGAGTSVWDNVHIRHDTTLGEECIVGEKTHISYNVRIGDRVKINAFVYVCTGVSIESGVMIGAGVVFTNDRFPRATTPGLEALLSSAPNDKTGRTVILDGASIGARSVIGTDLTVGRFAMTGMGSVVTRSVPDFHLVVGAPARTIGHVCRCGNPVMRFPDKEGVSYFERACDICGRVYSAEHGLVVEGELS